jgi:hypothetical protein
MGIMQQGNRGTLCMGRPEDARGGVGSPDDSATRKGRESSGALLSTAVSTIGITDAVNVHGLSGGAAAAAAAAAAARGNWSRTGRHMNHVELP